MNPKDLTFDQVKAELASLIANNPGRMGSVPVDGDYSDYTCVYYKDADGSPINLEHYNQFDNDVDSIVFGEPVCLVAQWVEDFHPEFKQIEVFKNLFARNATVQSLELNSPFMDDVQTLIQRAQNKQDGFEAIWGAIDLDNLDY